MNNYEVEKLKFEIWYGRYIATTKRPELKGIKPFTKNNNGFYAVSSTQTAFDAWMERADRAIMHERAAIEIEIDYTKSCKNCAHSINGRERGYNPPCLYCNRFTLSEHKYKNETG